MSPIVPKINKMGQETDASKSNPVLTGYNHSSELTDKQIMETATQQDDIHFNRLKQIQELTANWPYELRCPLKERPEHLLDVPLDMLYPLEGLIRRRHSEEGINLIADSIKKSGQRERILVTIPIWQEKCPKDKLAIVYGWGRYLALKKENFKIAKVTLVALNNLSEAYMLSLTENLIREPISDIEEGEHYKAWIENGKETVSSIASKIGKSAILVYKKMYLLTLPPKVQEWIHNKQLPYSFGLSLLEIKNPQQQIELAKLAIEDKLTRSQLEAKIKEVKGQETLANMKLDVEKPATPQPQTQTSPSPIQRAMQKAVSKPFIKQATEKIEEISGSTKLGEPNWWLYNWKQRFEQCELQPNCGLCHLFNECHKMLVENMRRFGVPPKQHWKLIRYLYETARLSKDLTLADMISELEQAGFDSTEIRQEIEAKYKKYDKVKPNDNT